jgi:hypothetical protein
MMWVLARGTEGELLISASTRGFGVSIVVGKIANHQSKDIMSR